MHHQLAFNLSGYPAPPYEDIKAHIAIAEDLARQILANVPIVEREHERQQEFDHEIFRARCRRNGDVSLNDHRHEPRPEEIVMHDVLESRNAKHLASAAVYAARRTIHEHHQHVIEQSARIQHALALADAM